MATRNSSSPKSVKSELSPAEVRELEQAKDKLFIQIYMKRRVYFKRWRTVTLRYFAAIDKGKENAKRLQEDNIDDVITRYAKRIKDKRDKFIKKYSFETADDDETIRYLDGMDTLVKPVDRTHRKALIRKEGEYREKNQTLNPDTKIPPEKSSSEGGTPPGNVPAQGEESSYEDEHVPAAGDWKSQAGDSDAESVFSMDA
ncbi:hypothetical protein TMatcc_007934 [Talaromyces marneffei ATCC 18224]|uniref:Uncharacterized protein n=2 Tax=Talaromyces marneffei TaxID=37727 RepID=B6QDS3_TALMQ|nr:uncharacterized protein EYB26_004846 [Talaromyces marneffei]EEA24833.1 hypothetical protein PMAA_088070 [Talaromyces marneffei ATCC 18224]KAE8552690.1 hypothetical protein EYB25_004069 [Talaromyces marneffei]QGA17176.1 hypothetical protein EYB26_004846 [Talaromyces marneffei]